ncbi:MAG: glycoside hydrolase family 9 protein [Clostridium sp.]|nr:glycoside hydrolase family 9 protein [Clostridium sp.]MCM1547076.1 glycoside hydrolase family 9 protein [Ruminococcus sp.]
MKKLKLKKFLAVAASAATMLSSGTVGTFGTVTAEGDSNYAEALALSLYFFDANQCGSEVDDNCLTWRGNCHTYDAEASINGADGFDSSLRSLVDPDGDGKVDVSGGYHDAGDHIKFTHTMAFAGTSLAMSHYMNPGVYEKAGCLDHLKSVLKTNSDYLMKVTYLDASGKVATICSVVADGNVDHGIWTAPEVQTYERKTYWLTASQNNSAECLEMASALAGAAYVFKDSDSAYAAECMKYAKALYDFGTNHVGNNCSGMSFYGTDAMYQDEMSLAQAWFYINGEGNLPTVKPSSNENGCYDVNGQKIYDYDKYTWDKVWQGYSTLMYYITGDQSYANEMQFELNNQGGCPENRYNANGWGASRYNCAFQMVSLGLAKGDANSSYAKGAKFQMDYILGNNSFGYSFLIGYGNKWPTHIHHRAANPGSGNQTSSDNPDSKYVLYGALIGGPDSSGTYEDHADRYQFTEPALDYNGCFALACAGLANLYGGDASEINNVIKNASEINENYVFGDGNVTPPTPTEPPTEEPTEEPTEPPTEEPTNPETTEPPVTTPEPTDEPTEASVPTDPQPTGSFLPAVKYGDVDESGAVVISDLVLLNKYLLAVNGVTITPQGLGNADVDANGIVEQNDSSIILNFVSNQIQESDFGKK